MSFACVQACCEATSEPFLLVQVPFIAHKQLGDSYKWLLYGDDDTVWFMDGVLKFLEDLDPDMPYFISGQRSQLLLWSQHLNCKSETQMLYSRYRLPQYNIVSSPDAFYHPHSFFTGLIQLYYSVWSNITTYKLHSVFSISQDSLVRVM